MELTVARPRGGARGLARRLSSGDSSATAVIQRFGAIVLGLGYLTLCALATASYSEYSWLVSGWWPALHLTALVLCALMMLFIGISGRHQLMGCAAVGSWLLCLLSLTSWLIAWQGENLGLAGSADRPILQGTYLHLPAIALSLARKYTLAVIALLSCVGVGFVAIGGLSYGRLDAPLVAAAFWSFGVALVYVTLFRAVIIAADRMDDEQRQALRAAREGTWYTARDREGRRLDALVHDQIIALLSELRSDRTDAYTADQARGILHSLENWSVEADAASPGRDLTAAEVARKLSTAVAEVGGSAGVRVDVDDDADGSYPFAMTVALGDAAVEAVRNSLRHAGRDATCLAVITVRRDAVIATVVDDGIGFEPEQLPSTSIGMQIAIRERMSRIDGGAAEVQSVPGSGTRVRVSWQRPSEVRA